MPGDMFDLSGKVAIVTGGNGGIGLGIANGLAGAGASVAVAARNQAKTSDAVELLRANGVESLGLTTDVADESSVASAIKATVDRFGRLDILVNNAGINIRKPPQDFTVEEWERIVAVNLKGTFLCSRVAYLHMRAAGGGKIINIGSMTSIFGIASVAVYGATKGGVVQLGKSLATAWAKDNIQVNTILPGWINTELTAPIGTVDPDRHALISSRIPSGRWGEPEDLAGTAVFLASRASDYVTGAAIPVDGGYTSF